MSNPIIDIENTSLRLKEIREQNNIKISQLQSLFGMINPQSIYNWENPQKKNLPRIDNLVILAKTYNVSIDDLIVLKQENSDYISVYEYAPFFTSQNTVSFLNENASQKTIQALSKFYKITLLSY
ncbi:MAG: helix-turn-helix transcriptional regulator [Treponema sp.]|nr:helix-turn-helix transcriptional regulator [Candidatus Treponema equifaecale]